MTKEHALLLFHRKHRSRGTGLHPQEGQKEGHQHQHHVK